MKSLKNISKYLFISKYLLIMLFLINTSSLYAQNVYIPDPVFRNYLNTNFPGCMDSPAFLNTTCAANITGIINIPNLGIIDLTGIEYFSSIVYLNCSQNNLIFLPTLPNSLEVLICNHCNLNSLPQLPSSLKQLNCQINNLSSLPALPSGLIHLNCSGNNLSSLPQLSNSLNHLYCISNNLSNLPTLPNSLKYLHCDNNNLNSIPTLPDSLKILYCSQNNLSSLPAIPDSLEFLSCSYNHLSNLPALPDSLKGLYCNNNNLISLPSLSNGLLELICSNNNLSTLPTLPYNLNVLYCNNNNISCYPTFPNSLSIVDLSNNPFNCLPNYIYAFNTTLLTYPLCTIGNSNNCENSVAIMGHVLNDLDNNCNNSSGDIGIQNINLNLYDSNNVFVGQTSSLLNGRYNFHDTLITSIYYVEIDTIGKPFEVVCSPPGVTQQILNNIPISSYVDSIDFFIRCKPGFDVGVQSIMPTGWVFPGQMHMLQVFAGNIPLWYNLNCLEDLSGEVIIQINGPVSYLGVPSGVLVPSVSGNTFTYNIADFSTVNLDDFILNFTTNISAQTGDNISVMVLVNPQIGDLNPTNNSYQFCYEIVNSYDPNRKEVYPSKVQAGYNNWLTYTVYFQNTGTAPAFNIRVIDTLSELLDHSSMNILNYSHGTFLYELKNGIAVFYFNNIMLPDSASNPLGSIGYVQFKIKPKQPFTNNTIINNQVGIYFDFNPPITTNVATTSTYTASLKEEDLTLDLTLYPIPSSEMLTIKLNDNNEYYNIVIVDINGRLVKKYYKFKGTQQLSVKDIERGVYIIQITTESGKRAYQRFIVN